MSDRTHIAPHTWPAINATEVLDARARSTSFTLLEVAARETPGMVDLAAGSTRRGR